MKKKLLKGGAWVLLGQAGTALSQILIAILLARLLAPEDYGAFQVIQRIIMFGALVASFGMGWAIVRAVAEALSRENNLLALRQVKSILAIVVVCSAIVDLLYLFYGTKVSNNYLHIDLSQEMYFVIVLIFLTAMQQVLPEGFRGMHDLKFASLLSGPVVNLLFLIGVMSLALMEGVNLSSTLWSLSVSTGLVVIVSFIYLQRKLVNLPPLGSVQNSYTRLTKDNLVAGYSFTATNLVNFFVTQSDLWIVAAYFSVQDAAYYAAASRLAFLMSAPAMLANGTLRPTIVSLWSEGDKAKLQSILRTVSTGSVALTLLPLVILAFYGSWVMELFFGSFYRDGGNALFIISLGWFSLLIFGPAGTLMMLVGKQKQYFYCTLLSAVIFLLAALVLPDYFAVQGVAGAVALGTFANSALAAFYVWRVMGIKTFCYLSKEGAVQ